MIDHSVEDVKIMRTLDLRQIDMLKRFICPYCRAELPEMLTDGGFVHSVPGTGQSWQCEATALRKAYYSATGSGVTPPSEDEQTALEWLDIAVSPPERGFLTPNDAGFRATLKRMLQRCQPLYFP